MSGDGLAPYSEWNLFFYDGIVMSEALNALNNTRRLRVQARRFTLEALEEMLENLSLIIDERRVEDAMALRGLDEHNYKLNVLCQKLIEDKVDITELFS